jgi:hypothetical protein
MGAGPMVLVDYPCECGGTLRWTRRGLFRRLWRTECLCGRCGPWRLAPESRRASPFNERKDAEWGPGGLRPGIPETTTAPPAKK